MRSDTFECTIHYCCPASINISTKSKRMHGSARGSDHRNRDYCDADVCMTKVIGMNALERR